MEYKGVFVDDDGDDSRIADRLSFSVPNDSTNFEFQLLDKPMEEKAEEIFQTEPDIVALDYRLDEKSKYRYKAGPLAQHLRDRCMQSISSDFPIILVSYEQNIKEYYEPDLTAHDLFDLKYGKQEISDDSHRVHKELLSIIKTYKIISKSWNETNRLELILKANSNQLLLLGQDMDTMNNKNAPHQLASTVYRWLIKRQGLLLDENNLYARIGVDLSSRDIDKLKDILNKADVSYTGIFSDGWPRWWDDKLRVWGEGLCGSPLGDLTADKRVNRFNEALGLHLEAAESSWREGHKDALFHIACASCGRPTEIEYSVPAYDPVTYKFVQKKAICWDCVQKGKYEDKSLSIDETGSFIADKLISGEIRKET